MTRLDADLVGASRALGAGRPLDALARLGLRRDAHALALRGIALAQLGELDRARELLTLALRRFRKARATPWMAKASAAIAEVDLARRDLVAAARSLDSKALRELGDPASAAYLDVLRARLLGMLGRRREAEDLLRAVPWGPAAALARAELLARAGRFREAADAAAAVDTENVLLQGEATRLRQELTRPHFRFRIGRRDETLSLVQLEGLPQPYIDTVRRSFGVRSLARSPGALALLLALARGPVTAKRFYGIQNESLIARLKVEVSRVRKATGLIIRATRGGFVAPPLGVLLPNTDPLEAILSDGEAWPPSAIAAALGRTVRSVERDLAESPRVRPLGRGRSVRYRLAREGPGIATQLLLLSGHPGG